jgi:hypothetical protein
MGWGDLDGSFHFVLEGFREQEFVRDEWRIERDPRMASAMPIMLPFSKTGGNRYRSLKFHWSSDGGFDGGQSAGEAAQAGVVRGLNGEGSTASVGMERQNFR